MQRIDFRARPRGTPWETGLISTLSTAFVASAILLLASPGLAGEQPDEAPYFAITGAKVVVGNGQVLEGATVVLEDGVITAVGTDAAIPGGTRVIDAKGMVVYPGLIDGLSSVALKGAEGAAGGPSARGGRGGSSGGGSPPTISVGSEDRPGTTPQKLFAHELDPSSEGIATWRAGGFTSAVVAGSKGLLPGQATFINLAGERDRDLVLSPAIALPIRFEGGGYRGYPGSLMGKIAYIRQIFLDAERYSAAWDAYEASPRGLQRPGYDPTLEPLVEAKRAGLPILLPGVWAKEIQRALNIADELGLEPLIIDGAHQAYAITEPLKEAGAAVLVNVDWPERSPDADPDEVDSLRQLRLRDRAPSTPKALHEAGIPFAFTSGEVGGPSDMLGAVKKAIDAGLPEDAAVHALTLGAAELYGFEDRLGSVEVGKMANLLVATGDLFGEKTKVRHVFVDGHRFTNPDEPEKDAEGKEEGDEKKGRRGKKRPSHDDLHSVFGDGAYGTADDGHDDQGHGDDHGHPHGHQETQQ